jgi:hypothetical protein
MNPNFSITSGCLLNLLITCWSQLRKKLTPMQMQSYLNTRVNARRPGTWRYAALNARYIRARVTICTVNSHVVYPVNARWANALSTLVVWTSAHQYRSLDRDILKSDINILRSCPWRNYFCLRIWCPLTDSYEEFSVSWDITALSPLNVNRSGCRLAWLKCFLSFLSNA